MTLSQIRSLQEKNLRLVFTSSITHEIRKFHVVVVQGHQSKVQKKADVQSYCCFANPNLLFFDVAIVNAIAVVIVQASYCRTSSHGPSDKIFFVKN